MKKLITLLTLTFSLNSFSHPIQECEKVKPHVVKRRVKRKRKPTVTNITNIQPVIEHHHFSHQTVTLPPKANRLFLLAGMGPVGIKSSVTGSTTRYEVDHGVVFGVGYEHVMDNEASDSAILGLDVYSNNMLMFKIGSDF